MAAEPTGGHQRDVHRHRLGHDVPVHRGSVELWRPVQEGRREGIDLTRFGSVDLGRRRSSSSPGGGSVRAVRGRAGVLVLSGLGTCSSRASLAT
jgi:hypothetical protein